MQLRRFLLATLGLVVVAWPAYAQDGGRRANTSSREIRIPTDDEISKGIFVNPRFNFSFIDGAADADLDRMDREIDRMLTRGICEGC